MKRKYFMFLLLSFIAANAIIGQDTIILKNGLRILAFNPTFTMWSVKYDEVSFSLDSSTIYSNGTINSVSIGKISYVIASSGDTLFPSRKKSTNDSTFPSNNSIQPSNASARTRTSMSEKPMRRTSIPHIAINPQYRSPAVAFLCSTVPGLGQFYNDEVGRGFAFMISSALVTVWTYHAVDVRGWDEVTIGALIIDVGLYIWQQVDAVVTADKKNRSAFTITPGAIKNPSVGAGADLGYVPSVSLGFSF
jgi:TM2 domain-containing membrane protein YozV